MLVSYEGLKTMTHLAQHDRNMDRATAFLAFEIAYAKARQRDEQNENKTGTSNGTIVE